MQAGRTLAEMEEGLKEGGLIRQLSSDVLALEMLRGELLRRNRQLSAHSSGPAADGGPGRSSSSSSTAEVGQEVSKSIPVHGLPLSLVANMPALPGRALMHAPHASLLSGVLGVYAVPS